jgi:hypothetical protein
MMSPERLFFASSVNRSVDSRRDELVAKRTRSSMVEELKNRRRCLWTTTKVLPAIQSGAQPEKAEKHGPTSAQELQ